MFNRRIRILLIGLLAILTLFVIRLFQLQVIDAAELAAEAAKVGRRGDVYLPFVRGDIQDRFGEVLAHDEACWDITVDYRVLANDLSGLAHRYRKNGRYPGVTEDGTALAMLKQEIEAFWNRLEQFPGTHSQEVTETRERIVRRVELIRQARSAYVGYEDTVREQFMFHRIVGGLDDQEQIQARLAFSNDPWVRIEGGNERNEPAGIPFSHLLGRIGAVDDKLLEAQGGCDDALRCYGLNDVVGRSGIEKVAEDRLRGVRGRLRRDRKGYVTDELDPIRGHDVRLTIRKDLQDRLYEILANGLEFPSRGGAIVVLHVPTRDVLALVSYPGYDPSRFSDDYNTLRNETRDLPLFFRAVKSQFAPGSIVKPLVSLTALDEGVITTETRYDCQGSLFPEYPDRYRCWPIAGTSERKHHGPINVVEAIAGSCNVFHYHLGDLLGVDHISNAFDFAGFGNKTGLELIEEVEGINPTPDWIIRKAGRPVYAADARNYAIGQGEVSVTPVQAANLAALYAGGSYRPLRIIRDDPEPPQWISPSKEAHWRAIREGIYRVINDPGATAYKQARIDDSTGYALCGKTGSAETPRLYTSFVVRYLDPEGRTRIEEIPAGSRNQATTDFKRTHPELCAGLENPRDCDPPIEFVEEKRWPDQPSPDGRNYSHAWFIAFLQPLNSEGLPDWSKTAPIALSVFVEFGGSGARAAGPLAKETALTALELLGPDLDPDFMPTATDGET